MFLWLCALACLPRIVAWLPSHPGLARSRSITQQQKQLSQQLWGSKEDEKERMLEFLEGLDPRKSDELLEYSIDSFLRGDSVFLAEDAPAPLPGLSPKETIEVTLKALRDLDEPEPSHGAAVLLRFCAPLSRGERWGGTPHDAWKELLRGALNPTMLARRIRSSKEFAALLDWSALDVEEVVKDPEASGIVPSLARVNASLRFAESEQAELYEFQVLRLNGVWMIDNAKKLDPESAP